MEPFARKTQTTKTLGDFVAEHRGELKELIKEHMGCRAYDLMDGDLEDWVLNDEGLYNWALNEGVDI
jgi:hypothetical protein